jgi:DNA-binding CsgD family transcriptional regulator
MHLHHVPEGCADPFITMFSLSGARGGVTGASFVERAFGSVLRMKSSGSLIELEASSAELFADLGLPKFALARFFDAKREADVAVLAGAFEPAWAQRYLSRRYWRHSLIAREILTNPAPYSWEEVMARGPANEAQQRVRMEARDFGLADGLFTPLRWVDGSYAAVVLAGAEPALEDPVVRTAAEILSNCYGSEVRRLLGQQPSRPTRLSPRQRECLRWVREGKSSSAIATIIGISPQTVDEYVADSCRKLAVRTRVQAVVEATVRNLLDD